MYYRELGKQDLIPYKVLQKTILQFLRYREFWDPIDADVNTYFDRVWTYFQGCFGNDNKMIAAAGLFMDPNDVKTHAYEMGLAPESTAEISGCMVLSPFRGRGICHKMVDALAMRAQVEGKEDLILAVHPNDNGMINVADRMHMKVEVNASTAKKPRLYYRLRF